MTGAMNPSHPHMQASPTQQAPAGASPFQIGGNPLFKTASKEPISAPPINSTSGMSPFAIAGATPTNAPLTVGDVIDQLPPEVVRAGALPAEQPLSLPPALLENALRSGQAALPVFELYRVCPALFQVPISPQDPRLVPLPAAKLPGLIIQAREGNEPAGKPAPPPASPSPFSLVQPSSQTSASPFQVAAKPEAEATPAQPFPMSPFAVATPTLSPSDSASTPASPFSIKPPAENTAASPFSIKQEPRPASPFSMTPAAPQEPVAPPPQPGFPAGNSPFSAIQPAASPSPFAAATSASPFAAVPPASAPSPFAAASAPGTIVPQGSISSLFTVKSSESAPAPQAAESTPPGMPFGSAFAAAMKEPERAPAPAPQQFVPVQTPAPVMPAQNSASSGVAKLGFAAVLAGYSVEELGFNPMMVPAWITTSVPASTLNEQISSGSVAIELGALLDGLSDIGFRNTLTAAKRDFRVKLPQNEVFHALTSMSSAPAVSAAPAAAQENAFRAAASASNAFVIQPGSAAGQVSRVEPASTPSTFAAPAMPAVAPQVTAQPSPHPLSAFATPPPTNEQPTAQPSSAPPASSSLFAPKFGAALNPFAQSQPPAPQAEATPIAPTQQPFGGSSPFAFTPSAPAEAPVKTQPAQSTSLVQPLAGVFQPFGSPPASQPAPAQTPLTKPFDPFAAPAGQPSSPAPRPQQESGFSSAQLLGQAQAPLAPQSPGLFSPPPANLFKPAPELRETPPSHEPAQAPATTRGLFGASSPDSIPLFSEPAHSPKPAAMPSFAPTPPPASASAKMTPVKHSFLGLSPVDTQTDQLLLRALLGTEENLAAPRVVELLATQHGLSACVCLHGSHVLSHADASKPDAAEFQRQAPDIARQLRGLAPLIGIDGAETFTLNAGGRLLTFCFPGSTIVAVLHDDEPSIGLRDKITLIARELARMLG